MEHSRTDPTSAENGSVLVPIEGSSVHDSVLDLGAGLATGYQTDLVIVQADRYPNQTPPTLPAQTLAESRAYLDTVVDQVREDYDGPLHGVVRTGHSFGSLLSVVATEYDADTVVIDANSHDSSTLARTVDANVVSIHSEISLGRTQSILVPVAGGPHSRVAAEVAGGIAGHTGGWVELLHVLEPGAGEDERQRAEAMLSDLSTIPPIDEVDTRILVDSNVAETIVGESTYYDCTILGAPTTNRLARFAFGSTNDVVHADAESPVLTVWDNEYPSNGTLLSKLLPIRM